MTSRAQPATVAAVAAAVREHLVRHAEGAGLRGEAWGEAAPDGAAIEELVGAAFWASLRREEGYVPRISLAYLPPEQAGMPMFFARPIPLLPSALAKVAPAVERPGIHLGVWRHDGELRVWGTTRTIPPLSLVLEVAAPGLIVVKHRRGEQPGKFVNVAVLEGDVLKVVDERAASLPDCPALLTRLLGLESSAAWAEPVNVLVMLALSMRAHGRGGVLLLVPTGSDAWRESVVQPVPYAASPPYGALADLMREDARERETRLWQDALERAVEMIAGLTAVDGAAVMNDGFELLGFGAKIVRREGWPQVERVLATEPIQGDVAEVVDPPALGGTRHLSAAQFVHDQHDALALVASQDGRFTVFAWSPCDVVVHAHRIETLLL